MGHEQLNYFECTESNAGPIVDFGVAGLHVLGTASIPLSVRIDPPRATIAVGEQVQLTATPTSSSEVVVRGRSFVWTSSDDAVASVSPVGLVTARAEGRVIIAANTGGVVGTAEVVVEGGAS